MTLLPTPPTDRVDLLAWVGQHLGDLTLEGPEAVVAGGFRGGQTAADAALASLDVTGYARNRSVVLPESRRGATQMSPYIRHGLLTLPQVWAAVADAPAADRKRYRDELLWQEYARHLYARTGPALGRPLRREQTRPAGWSGEPWPDQMACMDFVVGELHRDGWVVNQTRMWLASQWAVRAGADWRAGEQEMFAHLLDGSRAANRLGWQWTTGTGSGKAYGFSRWQVEKRSPQLCRHCPLRRACPIQEWPVSQLGKNVNGPDLGTGPTPAGPETVEGGEAELTWLTAESLGTTDPALAADSTRPAVFVFDEPLLRRLRLSSKRLSFSPRPWASWPRTARSRCVAGHPLTSSRAAGWRRPTHRCPAGLVARLALTWSSCIPGRGCVVRVTPRCARTAPGCPAGGSAGHRVTPERGARPPGPVPTTPRSEGRAHRRRGLNCSAQYLTSMLLLLTNSRVGSGRAAPRPPFTR